jgi:hypothetical protein
MQYVEKLCAFRLKTKYTLESLAEAQKTDPDIRILYEAMNKPNRVRPEWNVFSGQSPAAKSYYSEWQRLVMYNGVLYRKWEDASGLKTDFQFVVPRSLQREFCHEIHNTKATSHMGRRRTMAALQKICFWYKMSEDVGWWIRTCDRCQRRKRPQPAPRAPLITTLAGYPGERIAMDVCGPLIETPDGNQYVLVIGDYFTKYVQAFPMPNQTAETIAKLVVERWILTYGEPNLLHTDQGRNFESDLMHRICELYDIKKTRTSPLHPQGDGMIERWNKTMMDLITPMIENYSDWDRKLPFAVAAYNRTEHASTSFPPNYLMMSRNLAHTSTKLVPTPEGEDKQEKLFDFVERVRRDQQIAYTLARRSLGRAAEAQKKHYDQRVNHKVYKTGDRVLVKNHAPVQRGTKKLVDPWSGPMYVIDKMSDSTFRCAEREGKEPKIIHHDRLKLYNDKETHEVPEWVYKASRLGRKPPGPSSDTSTQTEDRQDSPTENQQDSLLENQQDSTTESSQDFPSENADPSSPPQDLRRDPETTSGANATPADRINSEGKGEEAQQPSTPPAVSDPTPERPRPEPEDEDRPVLRRSKRVWKPRSLDAIVDSPPSSPKVKRRKPNPKKKKELKKINSTQDTAQTTSDVSLQKCKTDTTAPPTRRKRGRPKKLK